MSLSIRQLKVFEATARLQRLTLAADEQALSQSAASQSLKELEQTLNCPLFMRVGRELQITDAGLDLLPKVRQLLGVLQQIENPSSDQYQGTLRIAASVTIACYLLPKLIADFLQDYPAVIPDIQIANTQTVISQLEKGQAHVGLIEGPASATSLTITPWIEDQLSLFCHPDHPLSHAGFIAIEEIPHYRWILRETGSGTRNVFDQALQQAGGHIQSHLSLNRQEAIKQSVRAGLGIGCLSHMAIQEELDAGQLTHLRSPLNLNRRLSIVTNPTPHPLGLAFIERLKVF
jgi:DNA-binding transcriptional LysR family regulator